MRFFKTDEEKAQEEAERQAREDAEALHRASLAQQRARREWLASPLGKATTAKEHDQEFFEVQLEVGRHRREAMWGSADYSASDETISSAEVLAEIERLGWRLEHVGYLFKMTGQSSSERVFLSGEETAVSGVSVGIYLFRNNRTVPAPDLTPAEPLNS